MPLSTDDAEAIAIKALGFLAGDEERLGRFFGLTGLSPENIRAQAQTAAFQGAVLDHLLSDESLLLVFCAHSGVAPEDVAPARAALDPRGVSDGSADG